MSLPMFSSYVRCKDAEELLDVYIDGEMDVVEARDLERHLEACRECADKEERRRNTRNLLRRSSGQLRVSAEFQARLLESLRGASQVTELEMPAISTPKSPPAASAPAIVEPIHRASRGISPWLGLTALAAAATVGIASAFLFGTPSTKSKADQQAPAVAGMSSLSNSVVAEAISWHRRAVPIEVTGPNATEVRDWFADKVNFAVNVPDLGRSARLLGGRLGHIQHHQAAYILYEANGAKLSVMIFGGESDLPENLRRSGETFIDNAGGYNVAVQVRDGVTYTFTSDMQEDALIQLVENSRR